MFAQLPFFPKIYLTVLCAILGLVMGSALNCLSYRIAHGQKWSGGRSVCPACGHSLGILDLIPLFSWLFLRGKCRYCKAPVSVRYPLTELCLAVCYTALLYHFDLSLQLLSCVILCSCLFCLSLVDFEVQLIPDRFLVIPAVVRIAQLLFEGGFARLGAALLPALALGGGVLILSLVMDKVLHKESMGGGDIKLLAVLGLYFSFPCCLLLLVLACLIGLILAFLTIRAEKSTPFPFGPAISIAAFFTLLAGEPLVQWYMGLYA